MADIERLSANDGNPSVLSAEKRLNSVDLELSRYQRGGKGTHSSRVVRFKAKGGSNIFELEGDNTATPPPPAPIQKLSKESFWNKFLPFRSPKVHRRIPLGGSERAAVEYPHRMNLLNAYHNGTLEINNHSEESPLLDCNSSISKSSKLPNLSERSIAAQSVDSSVHNKSVELQRAIQISAIFLRDYERARAPTLPHNFLDSNRLEYMLMIHKWKYSWTWQVMIYLAIIAFLIASCYEGDSASLAIPFGINMYAIVVFGVDIILLQELVNPSLQDDDPYIYSRAYKWTLPLSILLFFLSCEMLYILLFLPSCPQFLWSSLLKPICLFYVSEKSRQALEALRRIAPIALKVLGIELLLILSFAAVAAHLYTEFDSFRNLSTSWLSLFQLSTTVVNPSMWMPMYKEDRKSAFFFIIYVITTTFYSHSLVLSVVFQTYMQASTKIHDCSITDREDAIRFAFQALLNATYDEDDSVVNDVIDTESVQRTLRLLRPHYNAMKVHALVELIDPSDHGLIDFPSFRTRIRLALNASIRSPPSESLLAILIEFLAGFVAVANFGYVILLTSEFQANWFNVITFPAGCSITFLGLLELFLRANPMKFVPDYNPITRLNGTFDGLALLAGIVSLSGIGRHKDYALKLLLTGRAIDMIRVMRFFRIFRDIVRRSEDVFPALAGPMALVLSCHHTFVYIGMAIWGGSINVGANEDKITPLYDLNNFNSYWEGLVTMFQVLVGNDWQAIAQVYLFATRNSSPYLVYPFFVIANLLSVSILLNCLTAFFVGAFVTKLDEGHTMDKDNHTEVFTTTQKARDFSIQSSPSLIRKLSSKRNSIEENEDVSDLLSVTAENPFVFEFDVFEREGFDKIMKTVSGGSEREKYAKDVCDMLEVFENLSPGRSQVGYLVCCQQTMNRYGNRRFQTLTNTFLSESVLHTIVSGMHAELLTIVTSDQSIHRSFASPNGDTSLELSASILRHHPPVSLFVARIVE